MISLVDLVLTASLLISKYTELVPTHCEVTHASYATWVKQTNNTSMIHETNKGNSPMERCLARQRKHNSQAIVLKGGF